MGEYRCSEYEILEAMTRYGGSFVQQLAVLYRLADMNNKAKLATTFREYFVKYDEMAAQTARRTDGATDS